MAFQKIQQRLYNWQQARQFIVDLCHHIKPWIVAGHALVLIVRAETRSLKQNNLMWSCLQDLSDQVQWFGKKLSRDGWKDFITAHLEGQELVPNMDGTGFVALGRGKSTSEMTIAEMTAVIDLAHAFGAQQNVQWSPTSLGRDASDEEQKR